MDPHGDHGEIVVLKLEPVSGKLPEHPFMLRSSVEKWINGKIEGAFPEARGQAYALKVRSKWQLDRLLNMTQLIDGTAVKVTKHTGLNSVRCVINCRQMLKVDNEEILAYLKDQKVTSIRRITRRNGAERENTATVILTIEGTRIPEHVDVGYLRVKTRPYYPAPMLCYNCFVFGHTKARCQQQVPTCGNCSKHHPIVDGVKCTDNPFCPRCKTSEHSVSSKICPVYRREDAIQHIRIDKGISYPAARKLFEASMGKTSYVGVANASKDQEFAALSAKFDHLASQMEEKDRKIASLEERLKQGPTTASSTEIGELRKMIVDLQTEVRRKDDRIQALEAALKRENRLDLTRKHGTIEDLVARVNFLEAAVSNKGGC